MGRKAVVGLLYSAVVAGCSLQPLRSAGPESSEVPGGPEVAAVSAPVPGGADAAPGRCGSCHARPPRTGRHLKHQGYGCYRCHSEVIDRAGGFVGAGLHGNGKVEVDFSGGGSYDASTRSCASVGCHGAKTW